MKRIDLHQVDAFTPTPFKGNPAAVVTNADGLTEDEMKCIACEMNLDETAFVFHPTDGKSTIKVRYFTPNKVEIPFTGHATVGMLYELARLNRYGLGHNGKNEIRIETNIGMLTMWTEVNGEGIQVLMKVPEIKLVQYRLQAEEFASAFGIPLQSIEKGKKVVIDTNLRYVYIPITDLSTLGKLRFDFNHIRTSFVDEDITLFCSYTTEAFDSDGALHSRVVAPLIGFTGEDAFTGSTQGAVCVAARQQGLLDMSKNEYRVEQGDFMGRAGRATVLFDPIFKEPLVKATATHIFSTTIDL